MKIPVQVGQCNALYQRLSITITTAFRYGLARWLPEHLPFACGRPSAPHSADIILNIAENGA
jgi:hypothetical protein